MQLCLVLSLNRYVDCTKPRIKEHALTSSRVQPLAFSSRMLVLTKSSSSPRLLERAPRSVVACPSSLSAQQMQRKIKRVLNLTCKIKVIFSCKFTRFPIEPILLVLKVSGLFTFYIISFFAIISLFIFNPLTSKASQYN